MGPRAAKRSAPSNDRRPGARKPCRTSLIAPPLHEIKKTPGAAPGVGVVGTKMRYPQK
jgi:hypothetical protein